MVELAGALLRWSFGDAGVGWVLLEPFCSDGPFSGAAFFCVSDGAAFCDEDGAWPVVLFCSAFCAPLELWPVV